MKGKEERYRGPRCLWGGHQKKKGGEGKVRVGGRGTRKGHVFGIFVSNGQHLFQTRGGKVSCHVTGGLRLETVSVSAERGEKKRPGKIMIEGLLLGKRTSPLEKMRKTKRTPIPVVPTQIEAKERK